MNALEWLSIIGVVAAVVSAWLAWRQHDATRTRLDITPCSQKVPKNLFEYTEPDPIDGWEPPSKRYNLHPTKPREHWLLPAVEVQNRSRSDVIVEQIGCVRGGADYPITTVSVAPENGGLQQLPEKLAPGETIWALISPSQVAYLQSWEGLESPEPITRVFVSTVDGQRRSSATSGARGFMYAICVEGDIDYWDWLDSNRASSLELRERVERMAMCPPHRLLKKISGL